MENLEERVSKIEERNRKVELDKKWEGSLVLIFSVSVITYIVAVIALCTIKAPKPYLNSLIPVIGFILSTQSIPFIKKIWMKNK